MADNAEMNKRIREGRSAPTLTIGGKPDPEKPSMKLTAWLREEARRRSGEIPTDQVMTDVEYES